ncbi:MAG TPA: NAD(P)/FAD-dependent oxidoreductase [Fimbriimonadaceae bacterium]|jgi:flavin-dependent dehydrogenase
MELNCDVAIIGGGPSASTCGAFLRKYNPSLQVHLFERETFPRDHVGESQLPIIGAVLDEIGVWDKVEAAGFPIKIGGTYRWGTSDDLWDFHFLPGGKFENELRPAKFAGQRRETAFQVDRAVYDKILLDHAAEMGCVVHEGVGVRGVRREVDKVTGLVLEDGTEVTARHYVDASGHAGLLRRSMGVGIEEPSALRNIAIWDYWQDAEWAVSLGVGGTRIQVMSVGYGWLWFIPISETRTSVGFVCPADYYKKSGLNTEEIYLKGISDEARVRALLTKAVRENQLSTTKDWSFVAERMAGENWLLIGESAGFADPILSAGLSLAHMSAKEAAFTMLELDRGGNAPWLKTQYEAINRRKILQHIRFADYWYTANSHFSDLKEYTREIARDAGLELDADQAFQWLGTGGFIEEDMRVAGFGTLALATLHQVAGRLSEKPSTSAIDGFNGFLLDLKGAEEVTLARYENGRVQPVPALRKNSKNLPLNGYFGLIVESLKHSARIDQAATFMSRKLAMDGRKYDMEVHVSIVQALDAMARDGWIKPRHLAEGAPISVDFISHSQYIQENHDQELPQNQVAAALRQA